MDAVAKEDSLGIDDIHLPAKCYGEGVAMGVDKLRELACSFDKRGASEGVFVMTRRFAR